MSTTITETKTRENSLALRSDQQNEETEIKENSLAIGSQSQDNEDDNKSQESFSTVVSQAGTSQTDQHARQKKNKESEQIQDSDVDEEDPSPCGRCRKLVVRGDEALQCEICEQWFHIKCERVTKGQYKQQTAKSKSNFHWYCDTCDIIQTGVLRQVTLLNAEHAQFKKRLLELEQTKANKEDVQKEMEKKADKEDMEKLEKRVTTLEGNQEVLGNQDDQRPSTSGVNQAKEVIKEIKDQEERKLNVIIFNLAEVPGQDNQEQIKHDKEEVKEVGKICQANIKKDDITKAKRLGKKNNGGKPRPLLITINNEEKKTALFTNLKKLQSAPEKYKKISVQHDLTPKQRADEKALREEAKKMQAEMSGEGRFLVRGPPWARKIIKVDKKNN